MLGQRRRRWYNIKPNILETAAHKKREHDSNLPSRG